MIFLTKRGTKHSLRKWREKLKNLNSVLSQHLECAYHCQIILQTQSRRMETDKCNGLFSNKIFTTIKSYLKTNSWPPSFWISKQTTPLSNWTSLKMTMDLVLVSINNSSIREFNKRSIFELGQSRHRTAATRNHPSTIN